MRFELRTEQIIRCFLGSVSGFLGCLSYIAIVYNEASLAVSLALSATLVFICSCIEKGRDDGLSVKERQKGGETT